MKKLILSLALCLTAPMFSGQKEGPVFFNQESGFSLNLPKGFKHSWNIHNFDFGLDINVFQETDYCLEEEYFAITAQLPLNCANSCTDEMEFLSLVLGELDDIPIGKIYIEKDGVVLHAKQMPTIGLNDDSAKRLRMYISLEDIGEGVAADMQFFVQDRHIFMILTGAVPAEDAYDLDMFTEEISQSIRFVR